MPKAVKPQNPIQIPIKSLTLPDGYQHFDGYPRPSNEVYLNNLPLLKTTLREWQNAELRLYTQHEIFYEEGILKHTRSSPNWDGGFVTYSTCKHLMRTYKPRIEWPDTWIAGLCPAHCENNTILFVGCIHMAFESNFHLRHHIQVLESKFPYARSKSADINPRGDLYTPKDEKLGSNRIYDHTAFYEPPNHTRSVELYKKSPGSTSKRPDGKIPKWWRDIEYINHGVRPPSFILAPCFLFSQPMLWSSFKPGRAALKLTCRQFLKSLSSSPRE